MDYPIRVTTVCQCNRSVTVIATKYKVHNQDGSSHTCKLKDKEVLEAIICGYGNAMKTGDWDTATKAHNRILEYCQKGER